MNSSLLTKDLNPDEFNDYYFLKEELKDFCRSEGLKVSGSKGDLEKRITYYLSTGEELKESNVNDYSSQSSSEIGLDSNLGENFKCSEDKREFFENKIGKSFKFKVTKKRTIEKFLKGATRKTRF